MKDIFHSYMSGRLEDQVEIPQHHKAGPIITISRQAGCSSIRLAKQLAKALNDEFHTEWTVISKEVLKESASKLQLDPKNIKTIFKAKHHTVIADILNAFVSKDYQLEHKMRNTVMSVIRDFASTGNKVLLGRGANMICSDCDNALHMRIVGPLNWRIERVMKSKKLGKEDAIKYIDATEKNRSTFRHSIKGQKVNCDDFDLTINQAKFSNKEIIALIIKTLKIKAKH